MSQNYYDTLGVSKNATATEIKAAYRKLALQWHPDRNKTPEAEKKFKEINHAYETLTNPEKKQMYDQLGHEAYNQSGGRGAPSGWGGNAGYSQSGPFTYTYSTSGNPFEGGDFGDFSDPFDIFEQFFGGGGRAQRRKTLYQLDVTFDEAFKGVEKTVSIEGKQKKIKIPAGVDNNNRISFSDFDIIVRVGTHKEYKREGQDVYVTKNIALTTSLLGGKLDVRTLDGKTVTLKVKQGTKQGSAVRLKGKGFPYVRSGGHGDMYIIFNIELPEKLTNQQKKLIELLKEQGL